MPAKTLGNIVISYNSNDISAYLNSASLEAVVNAIDTTSFASAAQEQAPGATSYTVPVGGMWAKALDDILGADAVAPPSTLRSLSVQIGPVANRVTYAWTGSTTVGAFVGNYQVQADDPMGIIMWSGTLTISGSPSRT